LSVCDRPLTEADYKDVEKFVHELGLVDCQLSRVYHLRGRLASQSLSQDETISVADELKWHTDAAQAELASLVRVKMERFISWQQMMAADDMLERTTLGSGRSCQSFPSSPDAPETEIAKLVNATGPHFPEWQNLVGNDEVPEVKPQHPQPEFAKLVREKGHEYFAQQCSMMHDDMLGMNQLEHNGLPPSLPTWGETGIEDFAHSLQTHEYDPTEWAQRASHAEVFTPKKQNTLDFKVSDAEAFTPTRPDLCDPVFSWPNSPVSLPLPAAVPELNFQSQSLGWPMPKPMVHSHDSVVPMDKRSGKTSLGAIGQRSPNSKTKLTDLIVDAGLPPMSDHVEAWKMAHPQFDCEPHCFFEESLMEEKGKAGQLPWTPFSDIHQRSSPSNRQPADLFSLPSWSG